MLDCFSNVLYMAVASSSSSGTKGAVQQAVDVKISEPVTECHADARSNDALTLHMPLPRKVALWTTVAVPGSTMVVQPRCVNVDRDVARRARRYPLTRVSDYQVEHSE
jgi:hypothetical protein